MTLLEYSGSLALVIRSEFPNVRITLSLKNSNAERALFFELIPMTEYLVKASVAFQRYRFL